MIRMGQTEIAENRGGNELVESLAFSPKSQAATNEESLSWSDSETEKTRKRAFEKRSAGNQPLWDWTPAGLKQIPSKESKHKQIYLPITETCTPKTPEALHRLDCLKWLCHLSLQIWFVESPSLPSSRFEVLPNAVPEIVKYVAPQNSCCPSCGVTCCEYCMNIWSCQGKILSHRNSTNSTSQQSNP